MASMHLILLTNVYAAISSVSFHMYCLRIASKGHLTVYYEYPPDELCTPLGSLSGFSDIPNIKFIATPSFNDLAASLGPELYKNVTGISLEGHFTNSQIFLINVARRENIPISCICNVNPFVLHRLFGTAGRTLVYYAQMVFNIIPYLQARSFFARPLLRLEGFSETDLGVYNDFYMIHPEIADSYIFRNDVGVEIVRESGLFLGRQLSHMESASNMLARGPLRRDAILLYGTDTHLSNLLLIFDLRLLVNRIRSIKYVYVQSHPRCCLVLPLLVRWLFKGVKFGQAHSIPGNSIGHLSIFYALSAVSTTNHDVLSSRRVLFLSVLASLSFLTRPQFEFYSKCLKKRFRKLIVMKTLM
jgi:hypothetical protein